MRICVIVQDLYTMGGIQRVVTSLLNYIVQFPEYDITVLMPDTKPEKKLFELDDRIRVDDAYKLIGGASKGISKFILALNKRIGFFDLLCPYSLIDGLYLNRVKRQSYIDYINEKNFDIVIGVNPVYSADLALVADSLKCKKIGWMHTTYSSIFEKRGYSFYGLKKFAEKAYKGLDVIWTLTDADKKEFEEKLDIKTEVAYNPTPAIQHRYSDLDGENILFVGRMSITHKRVDLLADIIDRLHSINSKWTYTVVGDGTDRKWFADKIESMNLKTVVDIVGASDNVYQYYEKASVLLQTSEFEGFGMTITEAMSCGVPSVAFHNLGPDEIIRDGIDGFLVDKFDIETFVEKVRLLMINAELRKQMSQAALERAQDFSLECIGELFKKRVERLAK